MTQTPSQRSDADSEIHEGVPVEYLHGCQPKNQKSGYTKNGTLKAVLSSYKHQAKVIEEQNKIIEAQAAANTALEEEIAAWCALTKARL